jgi:hypothetical protein
MPQVIQSYGLTPLQIGLLTAIPYLFASGDTVLWGWHSDLTGERVALPLLVAAAAFAAPALSLPLAPMMLALTIATIGIYAECRRARRPLHRGGDEGRHGDLHDRAPFPGRDASGRQRRRHSVRP